MIDKRVIVETADGSKTGKLLSVAEESVVLVGDEGDVITVRKADATRLQLASEAPPPQSPPESEAPAEPPTDGKPAPPPTDGKPTGADRKQPAKHKLGLFTSHGIAYSHFSKSDFLQLDAGAPDRDGGPSYALDVGVGYNFSERFGLYGLVGGLVGAPLVDKRVRGHFGHVAVSLAFKRKYIALLAGLGVGFSGLRSTEDVDRRAGFALPIKAMGIIPLPKELFLGIGLGYDLGILKGGQIFNGISGQITVGRW